MLLQVISKEVAQQRPGSRWAPWVQSETLPVAGDRNAHNSWLLRGLLEGGRGRVLGCGWLLVNEVAFDDQESTLQVT